MSKPNITRVQSATQWTASVHTLHMSKPNVTLYTCPHPKDYSQSFLKYKRSARFEVRGPRSEVRGPRSEVRGSRSEVRGSRSEVRGPRFEVRGPRFEVRGARCEVRGARCEVRGARSEVRGTRSEVRGPRCEVRGSRSEVRGPRCEVRGARYEVRGARCEVVRSRRFHCQVRSQYFSKGLKPPTRIYRHILKKNLAFREPKTPKYVILKAHQNTGHVENLSRKLNTLR